MRTHASFCGSFPEDEDGEDPPGGPLADLIATHLTQSGFKVSNRDSTEYSHTFVVRADSRSFEVMLGAVADEDHPWLLFVESSLFPLARWFGWRDHEQHVKVLLAVHECLGTDSRISDLRWYTADEWNKHPERGAASPTE
jgi:hypothetical protein